MLPRHEKAFSQIKSAEKQLKDARATHPKMQDDLAKAKKRVSEAQSRLAAAGELYES
jgi:hypothetical protein